MVTFGEWLRQQRSLRRLTREEFAKRVGCSVSALRKIEDGERRPSAQIAELMGNCLDIPPEERLTFVRVARGELNVDRLSSVLKRAALSAAPRIDLPVPPTPLIGRQPEVELVSQLLGDPQCRLLTLVGPGGIGKTRIAIEAAEKLRAVFTDGVYFIPLASVDTVRLLVPVIADAIGFAFQSASPADPKTQLFSYLKEKQALLLTDNLEQLLTDPGIGLLAELLASAPQVKLLATSRESSGLQGEWVFEVQGLPIPEEGDAERGAQNTAVELFLLRARRAHVEFGVVPGDYPAIVRICHLVDGMPLGIELAAAWVRTLSCDEIAREIERGLAFLSVSTRDLPARHRSMRAVFDQSWRLLSVEEQEVLLRLSVFQGGFRREAAEAVAGAALPALSTLLTKSLIRRDGAGRFDMHELIRHFAAEQLATLPDEQTAARARHSSYYLTHFGQADARLRSPAQHEALDELTVEMDNFRAGWEWAVTHGEFALIEQTMRTFWMLYDTRGWFQEGLDMLGRAVTAMEISQGLVSADRTSQVALGHILATCSWLAYRLAHYERAQAMVERSLEILRPLSEPRVLVESMVSFGMLMEVTGSYGGAFELYSEGLEIATAIDDRWYAALFITCLNGLVAIDHGMVKPENPHGRLQSVVADWRAIGDPRLTAFALRILSQSAFALGRYDEARAALEESAALNSSVGDRWGLGAAYRGLGVIAQAQGEHMRAKDMFRDSLNTFTELGGGWWVARVLAEMSRSVFALGNDAEAECTWRESLRIATEIRGTPVALEALAGFASLQAKRGSKEHALELLLIVLKHPSSLQETKVRAERLQSELESQLTSLQIEAVQARVQAKSYETAVDEVLGQAKVT